MDFKQIVGWFWNPVRYHYVDFSGRTARKEFWMFVLITLVLRIVLGLIGINALDILFALAIFLPSLAITARRFHDIGWSGWWQLIGLIPILGFIVMIVLLVRKGEEGANKYGTAPVSGGMSSGPGMSSASVTSGGDATPGQM